MVTWTGVNVGQAQHAFFFFLKPNQQLHSYFLDRAFACYMLCDLPFLVHNIILDLHSNVLKLPTVS